MELKVTTLSENTASMSNCLGEWGLSILIETPGMKVLLDTGKSISLAYNVETLGVDLKQVDKIVLSHGHSDHTGGLRDVLSLMKKEVEIIAHPDVWQLKYDHHKNAPPRFIGIPFQQEMLENMGARFNLTTQPVKINDTITTTGEVPMVTDYEKVDAALFYKEGGKLYPDQVLDDRAVIVNTEQGLVIILGCAHRGMINTIYHAQQITGVNKVLAVIGGAHLINTPEERLWHTIDALRELKVEKMGLCHCTDLPAAGVLAQEFGENFFYNKAGTRVNLS